MSDRRVSSLRNYWAKLTGSVHPDDELVFRRYPRHTFDLRFPPPAFIGDLSAPIVILMSNGAYKPGITEAEFPNEAAVSEYRSYIRGDVAALPPLLANYYARGLVGDWIPTGDAVVVNAVPYRSPRLSKEPHNQEVVERLLSLAEHRRWVMKEVVPEAVAERRFLLVHRNGLWKIPPRFAGACVLFSNQALAEPNRQWPDREKLERAQAWLLKRHQSK
jgi:hypothetical protein